MQRLLESLRDSSPTAHRSRVSSIDRSLRVNCPSASPLVGATLKRRPRGKACHAYSLSSVPPMVFLCNLLKDIKF
jgi:hypothetical protein